MERAIRQHSWLVSAAVSSTRGRQTAPQAATQPPLGVTVRTPRSSV
jgi:hypothetical protein